MTFDKILDDGRLWAVRYDGEEDDALTMLFDQWSYVVWLRSFFKRNWEDLTSYFKITDVNDAIADTIEDSGHLQCLIMDEREHTQAELFKMDKVRNFLIQEDIVDDDSFIDYVNTL